jgi:hypothetical protein
MLKQCANTPYFNDASYPVVERLLGSSIQTVAKLRTLMVDSLECPFDRVCDPLMKGWTKASRVARDYGLYLLQIHQNHRWAWAVTKALAVVIGLFGTSVGFYFGWQSVKSSRESNWLTIKSICLSGVSRI